MWACVFIHIYTDHFQQAINDIRKKYEVEKLEIVNMEKENVCSYWWSIAVSLIVNHVPHILILQADKVVQEIQRKCDQTLAESKEQSRQQLIHIQEEHASLVSTINF